MYRFTTQGEYIVKRESFENANSSIVNEMSQNQNMTQNSSIMMTSSWNNNPMNMTGTTSTSSLMLTNENNSSMNMGTSMGNQTSMSMGP
jgi:hypothetical protein